VSDIGHRVPHQFADIRHLTPDTRHRNATPTVNNSTMKAVTIVSHGDVEGLEVREIDAPPEPVADRVRVRVHAAALNRADILQRLGRYPAPPGFPQSIPGLEFAGEIESIGSEVSNWKPGQRVFGIIGGGAQAELLVIPENQIAEIPSELDWTVASAVPEAFITAHDALFTQAGLQSGETVLVHAAGSGVGTAAIQLAHAAGAKVFGTSRTQAKLDRAKQYGLNGSIVVEGDPSVLVKTVHEWTNGRGVDVILDLVGAEYLSANLSAIAPQGRMILVGTTSGSKAMLDFGVMMSKRVTMRGTVLRARSAEEKARATRLFAKQVVPLLADGKIRPVIDKIYKLEEVREAHIRLESNESFGKVVLLIG
jgi:putative PIG3 family NAD(P)H quinone oxidoreductase